MHEHLQDIIRILKRLRRGIVASCEIDEFRKILSDGENYSLIKKTSAIHDRLRNEINHIVINNKISLFEEIFEKILAEEVSYVHPACWALFWAITEAEHETMKRYRTNTHEPELNGALISLIGSCLMKFRAYSRKLDVDGMKDFFVVELFDTATDGNEARTGADFAIIIDCFISNKRVLFPALIQAKRADNRVINVYRQAGNNSTQLNQLLLSEIGNYLFYNEFDDAVFPPTSMSAELVKSFGHGSRVETLHLSDGFAARIAFGLALGETEGTIKCEDAEEALLKVYNPKLEGINPGNPLICVLNDREFTPKEEENISEEWRLLVAEAKLDLENGYHPFSRRTSSGQRLGG